MRFGIAMAAARTKTWRRAEKEVQTDRDPKSLEDRAENKHIINIRVQKLSNGTKFKHTSLGESHSTVTLSSNKSTPMPTLTGSGPLPPQLGHWHTPLAQ